MSSSATLPPDNILIAVGSAKNTLQSFLLKMMNDKKTKNSSDRSSEVKTVHYLRGL